MKKFIFYAILIFGSLIFLYPFIWMIFASVAPENEIGNLILLPSKINFSNYFIIFDKIPIGKAFINSLIVSGTITIGVLIFSSMVGYALARLEFKGRNLIFYVIVFTMTLPFQITLIPQYILIVKFGWIDSYAGLVIPYLMNAFAIIMFRQYFKSIPQDLIDAARIDGCSELRIIYGILWPNSIPAIITVGIITFMTSWNEVLWPLIVIRDESKMTMPQLVTLFAVGGRAESQLGLKLAAAALLALPIVIAYLIFQKYFIQSMASTGMKE
ncbi:MAG: carbohydrate ABC transporter permease [Melioribacteraceae bacterium]